jgi:RHS repeat-associated protein
LLNSTPITATGSYELVNTVKEQVVMGTSLAAGFYKIRCISGTVTLSYGNAYGDISYFFYDHLGRLLVKTAPNGVQLLKTNGLAAYPDKASLPFTTLYQYDQRGRLIAMVDPDAGRSEYVYRNDGQIRFSQNAEQRKTTVANPHGRYSYVDYDSYGRGIESGEYIPAAADMNFATVRSTLLTTQTSALNPAADLTLSMAGTRQDWIRTTYDLAVAGSNRNQDFVVGAVAYTEGASGSKTWYSYDEQGQLSWLVQHIPGLGLKTIDYTYDFLGKVRQVAYQKDVTAERFYHHYRYDADQRLIKTETSRDGSSKTLQAQYSYYLHGPLKRVELGNQLQGMDYVYTAQGWLKSINNANLGQDPGGDGTNGVAPDVFGLTLDYFSGDYLNTRPPAIAVVKSIPSLTNLSAATYPPLYEGSIRAQSWQNQKLSTTVGSYAYQYDAKGQLQVADFGSRDFAGNFTRHATDHHLSALNYDANGNILSLKQSKGNGVTADDFSNGYFYQSSPTNPSPLQTGYLTNRLAKVNNYATFGYNAIGQLTSQTLPAAGVQGFNGISYNVTGKVKGVTDGSGNNRVSFTYNERGLRASKTAGGVTYSYVYDAEGNVMAIYQGTILKEVPVYGSGRVGVFDATGSLYRYELTDHLGNVRAVLDPVKLGGNADVQAATNYYPFGDPMPGRLTGTGYRYGYQGQYAEKDEETGWNSFELRMYDARIGRWLGVDPYGQYSSPYVAVGNNPVSGVDPDGGEGTDYYKNKKSGEVIWIDGSGYVEGFEHLGANRTDRPVVDAVGDDIMKRGFNAFTSYLENPRFGEDFFF